MSLPSIAAITHAVVDEGGVEGAAWDLKMGGGEGWAQETKGLRSSAGKGGLKERGVHLRFQGGG